MKRGYLSEHFAAVAMKRLTSVEANAERSNQHELNGVEALKDIFGKPHDPQRYDARFLYFSDRSEEPVADDGLLTWYDARQKARLARNVMRWEYRLYFTPNEALKVAEEGDLLVIAQRADSTQLLTIVAERGSTIEHQLLWLFCRDELIHDAFVVRSDLETSSDQIGYAAKTILEQIGVQAIAENEKYLEEMHHAFGGTFPTSDKFSAYARSTLPEVSALDDADNALLAWMEREESLFRTLERHLLKDRLQCLYQTGEIDPDAYMKIALSFLQRRRSRAGSAFENHIEQVFVNRTLLYTRTGVTEKKLKPDFIFPTIIHYRNQAFSASRLTMLAVKTTCRDRWRQILNEAARIPKKHLITLEPSISEDQTDEMRDEQVELVVPKGLCSTYSPSQQKKLMNFTQFIELVIQRESET